MANPMIFAQYAQPVKSAAAYAGEYTDQAEQRQRNALAQLVMQSRLRADEAAQGDSNALSALMQQYGGDEAGLVAGLRKSGRPSLYAQSYDIEGKINARAAAQAKAAADERKLAMEEAEARQKAQKHRQDMLKFGVMALQAARNPQEAQQAYVEGVRLGYWGMQQASEQAAKVPQDPREFEQWRQWQIRKILDLKEQMPTLSSVDLGGTQQFVSRDPVSGAVTVNKTNTKTPTVAERTAQGQLSLAQKRYEREVEQDKLPQWDAATGSFVDRRTRTVTKPAGSPGKPLPEGAQKQVVGARNLQDAIDNYVKQMSSWSKLDMTSPSARKKIGTAYNNMMLQAKEAYNLGVLNGPDYDILQSVVADPTKLQSALVDNDALQQQALDLKKIAENIERTVLESHGKPYVPRDGGAPGVDTSAGVPALDPLGVRR